MMKFEEFTKAVLTAVREKADNAFSACITTVTKNNGVIYCGLQLRSGVNKVAPLIYLEPFFDDYKDGADMDKIVWEILDIYKNASCEKVDMSFFQEFSTAKEKLCMKLINREANKKLLENAPYREFLDMAVVYYADCHNPEIGGGAIQIYNSHMEKWGVTEKDLWEAASINTTERHPGKIAYMEDIMAEMIAELGSGESGRCSCGLEGSADAVPMLVVTNAERRYGAAVVLYEGMLKQAADKIDSDLFILPSSIHEVIALPVNRTKEADTLKKSVMAVNRSFLLPEEVLSDNVYIYRREQDSLEIA